MRSLLDVSLIIAAQDTLEDTRPDILACASSFHSVLKCVVGFFEGIKGILNPVRSTRNVVFWTIRILDRKTVVPFRATIDSMGRLEHVSLVEEMGEVLNICQQRSINCCSPFR